MRLLVIALLGLAIAISFGVAAQDEVGNCDYVTIQSELAEMVAALTEAEDPDAALLEIEKAVIAARVECGGLVFSSEEEGMSPVIGPVEIPEGLYRATVVTDGFMTVEVEAMTGECEPRGYMSPVLFLIMMQGANNAEALLESSGCEALISISNTVLSTEWTLEFEKLQ